MTDMQDKAIEALVDELFVCQTKQDIRRVLGKANASGRSLVYEAAKDAWEAYADRFSTARGLFGPIDSEMEALGTRLILYPPIAALSAAPEWAREGVDEVVPWQRACNAVHAAYQCGQAGTGYSEAIAEMHRYATPTRQAGDGVEPTALGDRSGPCLWFQDVDDGSWDTACGQKHQFSEGAPCDNSHAFCPYCGGRLIEHNTDHTERG